MTDTPDTSSLLKEPHLPGMGNADTAHEHALPVYQDRLDEANRLESQGLFMLDSGKTADAFHLFREVFGIHQEINNKMGEQAALGYLARTAHAANAGDHALLLAETSLEIGQQLNDEFGQAINLNLQMQIWFEKEDYVTGLAAMLMVQELSRQMGDEQAFAKFESAVEQLKAVMPDENFQNITQNSREIRLEEISRVKERFVKSGKNLFDLPEK